MRSPNRRHDRRYFYKYTSVKAATSVLINKKLRLTSPLQFNDPFDIPRILKLAFTGADLTRGVVQELVRLARDSGYDITGNLKPKMRAYLEWMRSFKPEHFENLLQANKVMDIPENMEESAAFIDLQKQWTDSLAKTRILCLTEENDNPVMWNSYADSYRGVVLEIECLDMHDSFLLLAKPVIYTDKLPTIGSLDYWVKMMTGQVEFDYEATFAELEITKQVKWQYEKEWRLISFERASSELYSDYAMHPSAFSKVFLGKDMPPADRELILSLAEHDLSDMKVYEMIIDQTDRKIKFRRIK